ncbi:hypothetical protein ACFSL4_01560 [Streptomyces caeni]|uniref:Uncharacterized protein n=1 Tax=Streptomyces caeni TaxID=2307231 RepID=A0ABW4IKC2_9ACTN
MSTLSIIAIAVALLAVVGLCLGLADSWFCGLLALSCLLGAADAAYRELRLWALAFLTVGTLLAGAGLHAAYAAGRERRQP